jgi:hypothetical protein
MKVGVDFVGLVVVVAVVAVVADDDGGGGFDEIEIVEGIELGLKNALGQYLREWFVG